MACIDNGPGRFRTLFPASCQTGIQPPWHADGIECKVEIQVHEGGAGIVAVSLRGGGTPRAAPDSGA